jgi:hypothetical protein
MFKPIIVGIVFPFFSRLPWQLRRTPKMFQVARLVHEMRAFFAPTSIGLCKTFLHAWQMWCGSCYTSNEDLGFPVKKKALDNEYEELDDPSKRERLQVAWGKAHQPDDEFHWTRNGDHCMVPFECDLCIFQKHKRRSPDLSNPAGTNS